MAADKDFVKERLEELKKARRPWDNTTDGIWTQVEQFIRPLTMQWSSGYSNPIIKSSKKIFDGTGISASRVFCNGFISNTTPKGLPFIKPMTDAQFSSPSLAQYLDQLEEHVYWRLQNSDFFENRFAFIASGADLGTAVCVERYSNDGNRFVFQNIDLRQIYLDEDEDGNIDTVFRVFKMPQRQVLARWQEDMDEDTLRKVKEKKGGDYLEILHCVYERSNIDPRDRTNKGFKYASEYWICDLGDKYQLLEESGFKRMPYKIWRPERIIGSVYGVGPGIKSLRDSQVLQQVGMTMLKAANWAVEPAWDIPDDIRGEEELFPGGRNYRAGMAEPIKAIVPPINYPIGDAERQRLQTAVKEHYAVDYFMMLSQMENARERSQFEVQELRNEKLSQIVTITESYMAEHLQPLIEDMIAMEMEKGVVAPPPPIAGATRLEIEFHSPIVQVQRKSHLLSSSSQIIQAVAPVGQINPQMWDGFDADKYLQLVAKASGFSDIVRDQKSIDEMRNQRQQFQQQMMEREQANRDKIAEAEYASKMAKGAGSAYPQGSLPSQTLPGGGM